jgi:2-haloacid dehalogenase
MEADNYEVLSFDCYGTLVDWESGIISGLRPVLRTNGVQATDEEILALHAHTEHRLQSTSKKGAYRKYRDVLGEEVREAGGGTSIRAPRRWRRSLTPCATGCLSPIR